MSNDVMDDEGISKEEGCNLTSRSYKGRRSNAKGVASGVNQRRDEVVEVQGPALVAQMRLLEAN